MLKTNLPEEFKDLIEMQLVRDEEVLWVGVPHPLQLLKRRILSSLPFSLLFIGVAIFIFVTFMQMQNWTTGFFGGPSGVFGGRSGPGSFFGMFRFIFIGVFLFMLLQRVWAYIKQTRRVYVVTNQRAIIISRGFTTDVQSYGPKNMQFVKVRYYDGDYGDVIFNREMHSYRDYDHHDSGWSFGGRTRTHTVEIGFFAVEAPDKVEALLLENFVNLSEEAKSKRKNSHWD